MASRVRAEIGVELTKIMPEGLSKFFFTLGGAEAVESAVKMARAVTGRQKIMARYRGYHGSTAGAISLTGDQRRWANEPGVPGVVRMMDPYKYRSQLFREGDSDEQFAQALLQHVEEILMYEGAHTVAAIILEPVTGTNGIIIPPDGYIQGLRAICDKHGIMLIADEVMSGVGRTGEWWAMDHWKVKPDMITMAKGLTSAYQPLGSICSCFLLSLVPTLLLSLGAVAINEKVSDYFAKNVFFGGLTYSAHPMSLAAAVAVLRVMHEDDMLGNVKRMGKVMSSLMSDLKKKHMSVGDVRNIGLFGCFEMVKNRKTKEEMGPYLGVDPHISKVAAYLKDKGIYAFAWKNFLHTNPPLCVTEEQLKENFAIIDEALSLADEGYIKCASDCGSSCPCTKM